MTDEEKISMVKVLIGEDDSLTDELVKTYLNIAKGKMLKRLYPYHPDKTELPEQYATDQCELAVRLFLKRGAEGEITHNENSVNRTYGSVDEEDILSRLTPFAKVV